MPLPDKLEIRQIALEIYGGCNYKCPMCPQAEGRERDFLKKMPFETFKKAVDEALDYGLEVISIQGSGEPTLHPQIGKFIKYVKDQGLRCISLTNGFRLTPQISREILESGLDSLRISAVGYDRESYHKWMSKDAFDKVRDNVIELKRINEELGNKTEINFYHLITDIEQVEREVELYIENWVKHCGINAEIWTMHNWGGLYDEIPYKRPVREKRSCGRPNAPYLTVRSGGLDGKHGAVVPCCFVLGQDSKAVLGHLEDQTIAEVVAGKAYSDLREKHANNKFDEIDYCKNCDQLYDNPESLVWTNIPGKEYGQSKYLQSLDYRQWNI